MIITHRLPETDFVALATGGGDSAVIRHLREAEQSKHLMVLHAIAEADDGSAPGDDGSAPGAAAFRAGLGLLTRVQAADPNVNAWLLGLPHLGGWAHDCLVRIEHDSPVDFGHFACVAAAAAVRSGFPFELEVPVRDGRVPLPGLGALCVTDRPSWVRLRGDGEHVSIDERLEVSRRALVPDDGSADPVPEWRGTPLVRTVVDGRAWDVLLETVDPYLDQYTLPMSSNLTSHEIDRWRDRIQSAWEVLVRHHSWAAEPMVEGVSVIVPLKARRGTDLVSATTPAAFGAIATSWPPDPVTLAETLVHEFQHVKLCGLMDLVPLVEPGGEQTYAPWRQDPRPAGGLLQGIYAHLGIARFWNAQRHAAVDSDDSLHAQAAFARWRSAIGRTAGSLLQTDCLTQEGVRFARIIRDQSRYLEAEQLPADAQQIADEVALDHWLTWQVRHLAIDPDAVATCAVAYRRGEPFQEQMSPKIWIEEGRRHVDSDVRTRLLNLRYLEPARYRELCTNGMPGLTAADYLLLSGRTSAAVQAFRDNVVGSAEPKPDAWIGLALALHRPPAPRSPLCTVFADHLALMLDVHTHLGGRIDPLDLASWFA